MKNAISVPFHKLHGLGNDFIISGGARAPMGDRPGWLKKSPSTAFLRRVAQAICARHTGVGADGFLCVLPARSPENHARVRFFNADGSEAEISGNGIRCAGEFLIEAEGRTSPLRIETRAGVKTLELVERGEPAWIFRVAMGRPVFAPDRIPFRGRKASPPVIGYMLETKTGKHRVTVTSMGNPHCSVFVRNFDQIDWPAVGRSIELHPAFPNRTNVEFVNVVSRREIEVRFWERGVGITASSGTGSCGAALASILNKLTERNLRVRTVAGVLEVAWRENGEVSLTGPATKIAQGVFDLWR
ncbi:MAG: diaminopimelate epimerase [Terriglobia bacterium]